MKCESLRPTELFCWLSLSSHFVGLSFQTILLASNVTGRTGALKVNTYLNTQMCMHIYKLLYRFCTYHFPETFTASWLARDRKSRVYIGSVEVERWVRIVDRLSEGQVFPRSIARPSAFESRGNNFNLALTFIRRGRWRVSLLTHQSQTCAHWIRRQGCFEHAVFKFPNGPSPFLPGSSACLHWWLWPDFWQSICKYLGATIDAVECENWNWVRVMCGMNIARPVWCLLHFLSFSRDGK